jgi:hypothetical protein
MAGLKSGLPNGNIEKGGELKRRDGRREYICYVYEGRSGERKG